MTEKSAFKALFTEMVASNGDFSKVNAKYKKSIKVFVKESYPHFLISDGYFYVPAYFTKEAVKEFREKNNSHIVDLADKVIVLNKWTLETRKAGRDNAFGSYDGVEIKLVVQSFKTSLQDKLNPVRYPSNLFRDNEMKTIIQHYKHECLQKALGKSKGDSLPDISKVSTADKKENWGSKGTVAIKVDAGFKEGNTHSVELKDVFVQEKGAAALKKREDNASHSAAPKVTGAGKKRNNKADAKKASAKGDAKKVLKFTPKKDGKNSNKASVAGKKHTMSSPHGKKSVKTTDQMTMDEFKEFLKYNKKQTGKVSAKSGKGSKK
jgi:hypothetical protein